MGKASSAKKVARAARAGGHTRGKSRQVGFPAAVAVIVVLGLAMVTFARTSGRASADTKNPPQLTDHWHAAYGVYICDHFVTTLVNVGLVAGIHTHEDGLIHVEPTVADAGHNATLSRFFRQTGLKVTNTEIKLPSAKPFGNRVYREGKTTCGGKPAQVEVAYWKSGAAAATGAKPTKVITTGPGKTRITEDLSAYTFAFLPAGATIPAPIDAADIASKAGAAAAQHSQLPSSSGNVTLPVVSNPVTPQVSTPTTGGSTASTAPPTTKSP